MKYLLPVLFCAACAIVGLSQHHQEGSTASGPPSAALLEAMSSHGIAVGAPADVMADAPAGEPAAEAPQMQPALALSSDPMPVMQPAVYHRSGR